MTSFLIETVKEYMDWYGFQKILSISLIICIVYKFLIYTKDFLPKFSIFETCSLPSIKGNAPLFYISTIFSLYKQSTPNLPAMCCLLDGQKYLIFLQKVLPDFLHVRANVRHIMWFQHDGASAHFPRNVRNYLDTGFSNRWIGLGRTVSWPPDLSCLDLFPPGTAKKSSVRDAHSVIGGPRRPN
ncbi:unnamed protein product [Larinioides sclopetarius]|uniref:Transposase n=1 Tax=Larinioides sclopetarius TaxID=280406 RepID=A0AAV2BAM3_9ARAC